MTTQRELTTVAKQVAQQLRERNLRVVFAESCTGGLVSATLTGIPGISQHLCGSAVVYRLDTKSRWLGIPPAVLKRPGPVSRQVAQLMAENVLAKTPEADISAAVTGHLGPDAPQQQDGLFYIAVAWYPSRSKRSRPKVLVHKEHLLPRIHTQSTNSLRIRRQRTAAQALLKKLCSVIEREFRTTEE